MPAQASGVAAISAAPLDLSALDQPDVEPGFTDPQQAAIYYGALVAGDRRALQVLDAALAKARAGDGDPGHVATLEAIRARYQQRLSHHQERLGT